MTSRTTVYDVPDISCEHCQRTIETGLGQVEGINAVAVDVPAHQVTVEGSLDDSAVRALLTDLGYEARV